MGVLAGMDGEKELVDRGDDPEESKVAMVATGWPVGRPDRHRAERWTTVPQAGAFIAGRPSGP